MLDSPRDEPFVVESKGSDLREKESKKPWNRRDMLGKFVAAAHALLLLMGFLGPFLLFVLRSAGKYWSVTINWTEIKSEDRGSMSALR
jgi:hypothetical protein